MPPFVVCDTAKVRFFKQITTEIGELKILLELFAILQKYDFSSKSQLGMLLILIEVVLTFNGSITWVEFIFLCGKTKISILLMHKVLAEDTIKT